MVQPLNQLPLHPTRMVDQAAASLRGAILRGEHPAGSLLPPERRLAEALGINRLTLRAALSTLQAEGLVRPRQGEGVTVLDFRRSGGLELLPHLLEAGTPGLLEGFLALRRVLAAEAVAAGIGAPAAAIDALHGLAVAQDAEEDPAAFAERDLEFARGVLALSANLALELLFNAVARLYRARPEVARALHADRPLVRQSYHATVALLRAGEPEAARAATRQFLEALDAAALARLGELP